MKEALFREMSSSSLPSLLSALTTSFILPAQRSKKRKKNSSKGDAKTKGNEKKEKRTALSSASEEPLTLLPELVAELKLYIRRGGMEEARVAADRLANHHSASEDARERLLALRVVVILFRRSKRFRQALLELFPVFLDRTIGHKGESPLPPPRWASRALRAECIVAVKRWMADFGDFYPNLRVGYTYLKDKVGVRFVDIVAEQRMSARAARAIRDARNTLKASLDAIEQMRLHLDENNMSSAASGMIATMRTFWGCCDALGVGYTSSERTRQDVAGQDDGAEDAGGDLDGDVDSDTGKDESNAKDSGDDNDDDNDDDDNDGGDSILWDDDEDDDDDIDDSGKDEKSAMTYVKTATMEDLSISLDLSKVGDASQWDDAGLAQLILSGTKTSEISLPEVRATLAECRLLVQKRHLPLLRRWLVEIPALALPSAAPGDTQKVDTAKGRKKAMVVRCMELREEFVKELTVCEMHAVKRKRKPIERKVVAPKAPSKGKGKKKRPSARDK